LTNKQIQILSKSLFKQNPGQMTEGFLPLIHYPMQLDNYKDNRLEKNKALDYVNITQLFASNNMNHGVIGLTINMASYIYDYVKSKKYKLAIDVGTYKGGSAILLAVAMGENSTVYTIDLGDKEERAKIIARPNYEQLKDFKIKHNLNIVQIIGDSRKIELDLRENESVDVVMIDGGHTFDIVMSDFNKFGRKVKVGGSIFFDDCSDDGCFIKIPKEDNYMTPIIDEIIATGEFKFLGTVDRLGHFIRIK
jgi:predicted O-methyltransferase YrrM